MTSALPDRFRSLPFAHRALHESQAGRPENSRSAISAAVGAGYGIEIDLQLSADGRAMVFHDYDLRRLTAEAGPIAQRSADDLRRIALKHGDGEGIPTFSEVLDLVAGRMPLLVEIKDQDGAMGPNVGRLEAAAAADLSGYGGLVAVMSFNPNSVVEMARHAPGIPCGLVTSAYDPDDWNLNTKTCDRLRDIPDFDTVGACFISHEAEDLDRRRVQQLRGQGVPVLCWTIRSPEAEARARRLADNVTFEGYLAELPA